MPRVKRGVTARARHKKVLALAKGFRGRRGNVFRVAKQAVMKAGQYAYRDRRTKEARVSPVVDCAYQRSSPSMWSDIQPIRQRPEKSPHRNRPQNAGRLGCARHGGVWPHRRTSQSQTGRLIATGSTPVARGLRLQKASIPFLFF